MKQLKNKKAISILALALIASINLNAQTWTGATDPDFGTATNWSGGVLSETSTIVIPSVVNNPIVASSAVLTINTLSINTGATLNVKGSLIASAVTYTGGNIVIDGGSLNVRKNLNLGVANNPSKVNVNSGILNVRATLIVGEKGPSVLNINGGEVSVDQNVNGKAIIIGGYYSSGIVNLNGGFLKTGPANIGKDALAIVETPKDAVNASGYLNIDGGTLVFTTDQREFVKGYVDANKIRTVAGKKIVATYDAAKNLTNVTAVANLGIETQNIANTFSVYPNPSNGIVNIDVKNINSENLNVSVYDLLGKQILKRELGKNDSGTYSLDATDKLTSGTYLVNIKSDSSSYTSKIIVR